MSKYDKKELERLIIIEKISYEEIGRSYNVSGSAIKKAALRLGINLEKRRKINDKETFNKNVEFIKREIGYCKCCGGDFVKYGSSKNIFCSHSCQQNFRHKELYDRFLDGDNYFQRSGYDLKIFKKDFLLEQEHKCDICRIDDKWNDKPLKFVLDHIDGDASNNLRNNLRLICHNCDSQLDTYKSKNKNSARKERYLKNYKN
jgi:hypothetical protein